VRLGLLIYGSLDITSGGFFYDRILVDYLRRQGDEVEVISMPWRSYGRSLIDNLSPGLWHRLREARLDLLLQDELVHPSLFWLNRRLRARVKYPIVAIVHHLRSREPRPAWQNLGYRAVERAYLASVDGLVCVSRTTRRDVERLVGGARKLVVANPGGDGLPGVLTREEIAARARASGPCRLIFAGNLIPRKELHTLLAALAQLPQDDWRLIVAGSLSADPPYANAIRRQIETLGLTPRVTLAGALSRPELAAQLAASHLLAVPSSYEGFGIVYLEAMRFGVPAIASTAGAAWETIHPGVNGFLVPPGDAAALAQCLGSLIRDRERLLQMSLAAHASAAAHPTWEEMAARVRAFLAHFET
jgi:glycosyltransferase involved in cell wall biosynthesis